MRVRVLIQILKSTELSESFSIIVDSDGRSISKIEKQFDDVINSVDLTKKFKRNFHQNHAYITEESTCYETLSFDYSKIIEHNKEQTLIHFIESNMGEFTEVLNKKKNKGVLPNDYNVEAFIDNFSSKNLDNQFKTLKSTILS